MSIPKIATPLLGIIICLLSLSRGECQTAYPILDARFWYAASRHVGESRVGSVGTVNKRPVASRAEVQPICQGSGDATRCALRFAYTFADPDPEEFVGVFFSLGRIGLTTTNRDGTRGPDLDLHKDSTFNFMSLMRNTSDRGISIETLRLVFQPDGRNQVVTVRVELEDQNGQKMFTRFPLDSSRMASVTVNLALSSFQGSIDLTAVKLVAIVLEENHFGDHVTNPPAGGFDIVFVGLVDENGPCLEASCIANFTDDHALVAAIARRDFETLIRLVDTKTGASLDRTLFRDLLHWGATGWLLATLPAAVDQEWVTDNNARALGLQILRFVDDDTLWGDDPVGKVGNSRGVIYRFGGIDPTGLQGPLTGTRKLDIGALNAVEASVIDTALFQFGAVWDPLFGFLDSFHPNLADFVARFPEHLPLLRLEGRWAQQEVQPLNKGGALLAQLNYLTDGGVWRMANQHMVIRRGIDRIYRPSHVHIDFNGDGKSDILWRNSATGQVAVWLLNGTTLLGGDLVGAPIGFDWQIQ